MPPPRPPHPPPPPPPPPGPPPLRGHRLPLPPTRPAPASLLLAPPSSPARALALLFPDSSAHLFPSLPSVATSSSPAHTPVPSPLAAAACFALLLPSSHLLFLSAHPSPSSPSVHLRAYSLASAPAFPRFAPASLSFKRHASAAGLPLQGLPFGLGVRLAGGVNAVALLSLSAGQIWVLAPKLAADGRTVELHKCAVVELEPARPVYAMEVAMGRLLLGEAGGLRVFPLRGLMKGGKEREGQKEVAVAVGRKGYHKKNGMLNGLVVPVKRVSYGGSGQGDAISTRKLTTLRVKQSSGSYCSFLLAFQNDDHKSEGSMELLKSVKAVSIHPLSKDKFLVLDSSGVLHVFSLSTTEMGSGAAAAASKQYSENIHTYRLDYPMKVQLSAVFSVTSIKTQIFWVSDGGHTVHAMSVVETESPHVDKSNGDVTRERELATIKLSAIEAILTSERVQDIVSISKDSVLILGQGNMFLYGTS
ncbi:hypothetical protein BDA96_03G287700 [Sorghum bicolor]|uniref:Uncharacterized protein n=1 Tax=Sorghum bicolor TaxID=4558 RepID=A0A921RG20_SORBI|nr:hypothetical protein BDA96_03G287700 [Sorghum bicolor]